MSDSYQRGYEAGKQNAGGVGCIGVIVILFILYFLVVKWGWNIPILSNLFKYQGKTAEQWHSEYLDYKDEYDSSRDKYESIADDAETARETRDCVNETKKLFRDVISKCTPANNCDLNKAINNGGLDNMVKAVDKAKIDCYEKYFE